MFFVTRNCLRGSFISGLSRRRAHMVSRSHPPAGSVDSAATAAATTRTTKTPPAANSSTLEVSNAQTGRHRSPPLKSWLHAFLQEIMLLPDSTPPVEIVRSSVNARILLYDSPPTITRLRRTRAVVLVAFWLSLASHVPVLFSHSHLIPFFDTSNLFADVPLPTQMRFCHGLFMIGSIAANISHVTTKASMIYQIYCNQKDPYFAVIHLGFFNDPRVSTFHIHDIRPLAEPNAKRNFMGITCDGRLIPMLLDRTCFKDPQVWELLQSNEPYPSSNPSAEK